MSMQCRQCGYDLTGLAEQGDCPECGGRYDVNRVYHTPGPEHPVKQYLKPIIFGTITVLVLLVGGSLSMMNAKPLGGVVMTLVLAALPALATWVYALEAKNNQEEA